MAKFLATTNIHGDTVMMNVDNIVTIEPKLTGDTWTVTYFMTDRTTVIQKPFPADQFEEQFEWLHSV